MRRSWMSRALAVVIVLLAPLPSSASLDPAFDDSRALLAAANGSPSEIFARTTRALGMAGEDARPPETPVGSLMGAARHLASAIRSADALRAEAVRELTPTDRALLLEGLHVASATADVPGALVINDRAASPAVASLGGKVDMQTMRTAASIVLRAIDDTAAALSTPDAGRTAPSICGASGDMLYENSDCSIMIGGSDANAYPDGVDPMLLIDVGGDDTYSNDTGVAASEVRVVVDVAGNDTYLRTTGHVDPGTGALASYGQGVGALGVGILADLAGDDSYAVSVSSSAPEPGPVARAAQASGQGLGIAGVGVLVDAGGVDSYTLDAWSSGGAANAFGQGHGLAFGVGVLISSAGALDELGDSYAATSRSTLHLTEESEDMSRYAIGTATAFGQGASEFASAGVMIEAGGDDVYRLGATGASARAIGQGGSAGGIAALVDVGGSDTLEVDAVGDASLSLVTTNPAVCWSAHVMVTTATTEAVGQGGGRGTAIGVLVDGGGEDARTLRASARAEAIALVTSDHACASFGGNTAIATASTGNGLAFGQGAGGALLDVEGNDANTLDASSEAHATAKVTAPGARTETPTATAGSAFARGQGFGPGIAADALGDDAYVARAGTAESETTSTTSTASTTDGVIEVHGWGSEGRFLDLAGDDTYDAGPGTAAADDHCWSNAGGRGMDVPLSAPLPAGCP